jgi:metal-dependent amidase/aminoacylase/carboxypeptidase family protein
MANKGFWDNVDAAIMLHPAMHYGVGGKRWASGSSRWSSRTDQPRR